MAPYGAVNSQVICSTIQSAARLLVEITFLIDGSFFDGGKFVELIKMKKH